jgi:hypothetical protein
MNKITSYEDFLNEENKPKAKTKIIIPVSNSLSNGGSAPENKIITPKFWSIKQAKPEHKQIALDTLNALSGFTENEEAVIKMFREEIKTKEDFDGVEKVWNYWWPGKENLRGVKNKTMAEADKLGKTRETRKGISFRNALGYYLNDKQLDTLNAVLRPTERMIEKTKGSGGQISRSRTRVIDFPDLTKEALIDILLRDLSIMKKNLKYTGDQVCAHIDSVCKNYREAKK